MKTEVIWVLAPFALTLLIFLITRFLGFSLLPHFSLRKSETIQHFITEKGEKINQGQRRRYALLSEVKSGDLKAISGECKAAETFERAIEKQHLSVSVICGAETYDKDTRDKLLRLKDTYPDEFRLYITERPRRHAMLIGPHLLIEAPHDPDKLYETIHLIKNAPKGLISQFNMRFEELRSGLKEATLLDIKAMPCLNNQNTSD